MGEKEHIHSVFEWINHLQKYFIRTKDTPNNPSFVAYKTSHAFQWKQFPKWKYSGATYANFLD